MDMFVRSGGVKYAQTDDGEALEYLYIKHENSSHTIILCGGMGGGIEESLSMGHWFYHNANLNVIVYSRRGYSGSTGDAIGAGEAGMYYDLKAIVDIAVQSGASLKSITSYGYSFGGTEALTAARYFGIGKVIIDRTLGSPKMIIQQFMAPKTFIKGDNRHIRNKFGAGLADEMFPVGRVIVKCDSEELCCVLSDGLNNIKKLEALDGRNVFVMIDKRDQILWKRHREQVKSASKVNENTNLAVLNAGHFRFFLYGSSPKQKSEISQKLVDFLSK
jgi:hypothetical protein